MDVHTIRRMREKFITDAMIIETFENGEVIYQAFNDRYRYEYDIEDRLIIVITDEKHPEIVTVFYE